MNEPQVATGFDEAERGRIRAALRRYMAENRISTPTLQYRVIEADKPRHREIPLSTLQRFITGAHHTQDHHVALCHAFVRELPWYGEGQDIARLGQALFGFLQEPMDEEGRQALIETLEREFTGSFETRTRPASAGGAFAYPPEPGPADSRAIFTSAPGKPWLDAREFVTDLRNFAERPERRFTYDGVLLFAAPLVYVYLRNTLTRQPRNYSLGKVFISAGDGDVTVYEGEGFETWFLRDDPAQRLSRNFRVQFIPTAQQGASP
jgi:hypothetical protein